MPDYPRPVPDTSTTLDVSGGTTSVATEDLEVAAEQLERLAVETASMAADLGRLELPSTAGTIYGDQARVDVELAISRLGDISRRAELLKVVLRTAATGYEITERAVGVANRVVGSTYMQWMANQAAPTLLTSGVLLSAAGGLWAGIRAAGGLGGALDKPFDRKGIPKASPFMRQHNYLINNSLTVSLIRGAAQSVGPVLLGVGNAPIGAPQVLGTKTFEQGARGLVTAGRSVGLFEETPVTLVETIEQPSRSAPHSYRDRLERVPYFDPETDTHGPQVVVEKYTAPGEPDRYSVYVGGTVTFSPVATSEPWDMTSNLVNATGGESGSVAAVRAAMEAAGVEESSPVQFTGYSQGGGTAARLAASGLYNTQGLVTFGGPTGQIALPGGFPAVLIEHSDDPVPALGGDQQNEGAVLVRRDVFGGEVTDTRYAVPSHHIEYYLQTAGLMDESESPQLDGTMGELDSFTAGATLESSTAYRFERD